MPLETVTYLPDLVPSNPPDTDAEAQGGAHLRAIKLALKNTFPNWTDTSGTGGIAYLTSTQAQIDAIASAYAAGALSVTSIKHGVGTAAAPTVTFGTDATSGLYASASGNIDISAAGALVAAFNSTGLGITGAFAVSGNSALTGNLTVGGTLGVTGATTLAAATAASLTVTGNTTHTGTSTFTGDVTCQGTDGVVIPSGTTLQRPGTPAVALTRLNTTTGQLECWNGTVWMQVGPVPTPTVTRLTTGTGTYTPPTGCVWIRVRMAAGGAGGGATVSGSGSNGGTTSFGTWTAIGGTGGAASAGAGGAGGTGGVNGTGTLIARVDGSNGTNGSNQSGTVNSGGDGGANPFGGNGRGAGVGPGGNAKANTGGGGSGGGASGATGGGGGAGEYVEFYVYAPTATSYTIGTAGSGGSTSGQVGGNGATGPILIEEFYQ